MFKSVVTGPLDLGAMMVAFVEVYDGNGNLFNPPGGQVRVQTSAGDFLVFLHPGDKGVGKCEFAPLMGTDAKYLFRLESMTGEVWSEWATCDLALPFVPGDKPVGQLHKSFYVRFYENSNVPPPPPPPPPSDLLPATTRGPLFLGQMFAALFTVHGAPADSVIRCEKRNTAADEWVLQDSVTPIVNGAAEYTPLLGLGAADAQFRFCVHDANGVQVSEWATVDIGLPWANPADVGGAGEPEPGVYRRARKSFLVQFGAPEPGDCDECPIRADLEARIDAMSGLVALAQDALAEAQTYAVSA